MVFSVPCEFCKLFCFTTPFMAKTITEMARLRPERNLNSLQQMPLGITGIQRILLESVLQVVAVLRVQISQIDQRSTMIWRSSKWGGSFLTCISSCSFPCLAKVLWPPLCFTPVAVLLCWILPHDLTISWCFWLLAPNNWGENLGQSVPRCSSGSA